jgi:hypothetical protein
MTTTIQKRRTRRRQAAFHADPILEFNESVALLEQATESNQKQIHELAETTDRQIRSVLDIVKEQGVQVGGKIESLSTQLSISQKTNWPLMLSIFFALAMLVGAAYKISDLQTQVTMSPIVAKAEISEKDRFEIRRDVQEIHSKISDLDSYRRVTDQKLTEVETQFRASDEARNVQFSEQQRMNNIIMQIGQGKDLKDIVYPSGPYYFPHISDHDNPISTPGLQ